ncbi:DNA polymerase V [Breznakibacter xylanolyticus]|uniref:DNA polymerase V n=1 Tax=Breznakibacter xylanolyticus TaxID=990 RepID=A0A2W7N7K0_9BACT|nr:Y-family DNA polymerase [Breznakibacter xylanolyticus]PZX16365.1 DNA polymerase V [Breznakibacter xylanolyticus]
MIALVDCNNFYASCERLFRPDLKTKPIVVLSNNDGCVIARSNESKALGIPMGAPAHECIKLIREHDVQVFSSNYTLYGDISSRVMNVLSQFAPDMEIYSIDEAFLCFDGVTSSPEELGLQIRQTVMKWVGIPVSIGFAPTKTLAKAANRIAKKFPQLNNVFVIENEQQREKVLRWLPIEDVWGLGRQYSKRMAQMQVFKAWDFVNLSDAYVRKHFTVVGLRIKNELEGQRCFTFEGLPPAKKSIATTRSFGTMLTSLDDVKEAVVNHAVSCAAKLRRQRSCAMQLMVFIHTNGFRTDLPQYMRNKVVDLPTPTNNSSVLAKYAAALLESIFRDGYQYKKAGVVVLQLVPQNQVQLNLFDPLDIVKGNRLFEVVDKLNNSYGTGTVKLAAQGTGRSWKLKQERISKKYTTDWGDLLDIGK